MGVTDLAIMSARLVWMSRASTLFIDVFPGVEMRLERICRIF